MRIGIACTLKPSGPLPTGAPDDHFEEFDSPVTVNAIADVFRSLGHTVSELGDGKQFLEAVLKTPPDLVFNFAEGSGVSRSRESRVPAVCEMLGIPCSGSDPLALAVALDKDMTRRLAESLGVTVPKGITLAPIEWLTAVMLNGDDNDLVNSCFVDDAIGKSMNLAAAGAL